MPRVLVSVLIVLHGLVHIWYIVLAQRMVEFQPEMGWSGRSWLFSPFLGDAGTRALATALLIAITAGLCAGGLALLTQQSWARSLLIPSAVVSALFFLLFWDGSTQYLVQKGLLGVLINVGIVAGRLWPA